jgi:catechol 2,3-dioxygenase-like lactoylglutathione lyase family enzyme
MPRRVVDNQGDEGDRVELGAFSVSLAVADMAASREFYEKLGFTMVAGDGDTWTIVANGTTAIGLFHGMFEGNILTFNPGWAGLGEPVDAFTDVRELRVQLTALGIEASGDTTAETANGPASFMVSDPDGNVILLDQHV